MNASSAKRQLNEAEALFLRKQYPEALALLTRLNTTFPNQRNIVYPMALCHEQLGRFDEARALCGELLRHSDYPKAKALLERLEPDVLGGELVEGMDEAHPFAADDMGDDARSFSDAPPKKQGLFQGFSARFQQMARPRAQVTPAVFGDPVAMKTSWNPMATSHSGFRSRALVQISPERLEYRCTKSVVLLGALVLILGIIVTFITTYIYFFTGEEEMHGLILLVGPAFVVAGVFTLYHFTVPMVLDKNVGYYWHSRKAPHQTAPSEEVGTCCKLADIHALQLIEGKTTTSTSDSNGKRRTHTTTYYELNFVLKSGRRLNIVSWTKPAALREDGQVIAQFLDIPLWDALVAH